MAIGFKVPKAFNFTSKATRVNLGGGMGFRVRTNVNFDTRFLVKNWKEVNFTPLTRAGLLVRKIMRNSIRRDRSKSQRPARPGRPPKSRYPGHPFKLIYSIPSKYDTFVVIGHQGFKQIKGTNLTVMEVHEFGKAVTKKIRVRKRRTARSRKQAAAARKLFLSGKIKATPQQYQTVTIKYPERKFAKPALEKALNRLPALWRDSISSVKN